MKVTCYDSSGEPIKHLVQWEINRIVRIPNIECLDEVVCYAFNDLKGVAEPIPVTFENNIVTTKIPNTLLQDSKSITINVFSRKGGEFGEKRFITSVSIRVLPSAKPVDYETMLKQEVENEGNL